MKQRDIVTNILAGAAAGLVGTIVLQAIMKTRQRYLPQTAPPMNEHPGEFMVKQAEKALPAKAQEKVSEKAESRIGNVLGMGYGMTFGAIYGALRPAGGPRWRDGVILGFLCWAAGYLGWLPASRLMPPIWKQRVSQVAAPIAEHALYGIATVAAYDVLHERVQDLLHPPSRGQLVARAARKKIHQVGKRLRYAVRSR